MPESLESGAPDAILRCGACPPETAQAAVVTFQDGSMPLCAADHRLRHGLRRLARAVAEEHHSAPLTEAESNP